MSKGPGREFGRVDNGEVDRYLSEVRQIATSTDWASITVMISSRPAPRCSRT